MQRVFVHEDIYEPFKQAFVKSTAALKKGDPRDEVREMGRWGPAGSGSGRSGLVASAAGDWVGWRVLRKLGSGSGRRGRVAAGDGTGGGSCGSCS